MPAIEVDYRRYVPSMTTQWQLYTIITLHVAPNYQEKTVCLPSNMVLH